MGTTQNKEIVRRLFEELITEDNQELVDELIAEDYVYRSSDGEEFHGRSGFREVLGLYREAFPDLHLEIQKQVADGDTVATWYTFSGTHCGKLQGIEPTDKQVTATSVQFATVENGRVQQEWDMVDQFGLFDELGVVQVFKTPESRREKMRS